MLCLSVCTVAVLADTLTLKDGTVLEGKVIPQADSYWIKLASGETKTIPKSLVANLTKGDAKPVTAPPTATPTTPVPPAPAAPSSPAGSAGGATSTAFAAIKSKADKVDEPVVAVQMWDKFLDSNASAADLAAAKTEKANWEKLQKDNAERVNGKWVGGEERKKLLKEVDELCKEGYKAVEGTNTVDGLAKFEKALKLYPNSFEANFELGFYYLRKGVVGTGRGNLSELDKGIKALETAQHIMPKSPATLSNLAIGYSFRRRYIESVTFAYQAAKIKETKEIVQNLVNAIASAPPGLQTSNAKLKPMIEDAILIAQKHGMSLAGTSSWPYIRPTAGDEGGDVEGGDGPGEKAPPGAAWSGSGFFISSDGYIITNHHVAAGEPKAPLNKDISFNVRFDDGTSKNAEVVAIDDDADISLMKVKVNKPVEYLHIADSNPNQAAKALVLGYPATGETNISMQISEGSVKSIHPDGDYNIWFDLNTTHGNSGGPIVDRNCHVIGILTAGWQEYNMTIVGGIGPLQIKHFLEKIGDKAPKVEYSPSSEADFNGEKLTATARKSTLFILAIRGVSNDDEASSGTKKKAAVN